MSHRGEKLHPVASTEEQERLKANLLDEFPALPEKFFTFTHEMIALLWMKETTQTPVRGRRPLKK
jgi:hypothetical protein